MTTDDELHDENLKRSLEDLARRGQPRGAANVLEAARRDIGRGARPSAKWAPMTIAAAAMLLVVSVAAVAFVGGDDRGGDTLAGPGAGPPEIPTVAIDPELIADTRLQQFGDCNALLNFARDEAAKVVGPYGLPGSGGFAIADSVAAMSGNAPRRAAGAEEGFDAQSGDSATAPSGEAEATTGAGAAGPVADRDFSSTNVQEKGVDEADTVKTDGRIIYSLARGRLWAISVDDHKVSGSLGLNASEFFLAGERVIAFGYAGAGYSPTTTRGIPVPESVVDHGIGGDKTAVVVIDVGDPKAMKVLSQVEIDGRYLSSRMVNGVVRVVTSSSPRVPFPALRSEDDYQTEGLKRAQERNVAVVRESKVEDWLPRMTVRDAGGRAVVSDRPVGCDAAYRPPEVSGFGFINVMTLNAEKPEDSHTTSVMADGQTVYASGERLYVATGSWGPIRTLRAQAAADDAVTPPVLETLVHQFDISDPKQAAYRKSGKVRGHVLNQFSMSEHEGVLRIATTDAKNESESFVTTLADQTEALVQIGQVGGLGKTERIYAVRFLGDVGYVVTFRQVDPLYTLDLSDPTKPRVVGELKITGYSAYLHPLGDGKLIGVGQEASPEGRRQGTQVSLFDVSNPAEPKRLAQYHLPGGDSPAEFDHHAFLHWAATKLTVIPYQQHSDAGVSSGGAVALRGDDKLDEVGKISHTARLSARDGDAFIQRSLVIGGRLYTVSGGGLMASDIDSLEEKAWVAFA